MEKGDKVLYRNYGGGKVVRLSDDGSIVTMHFAGRGDISTKASDPDIVSVPKPSKVRKPRVSLRQRQLQAGYIAYDNDALRERVPYDQTRNPEAHAFLLEFVANAFAKQEARIEVHAPTSHPTIAQDLANLMGITPDAAALYVIWGSGGTQGDAHGITYNLIMPNPNRLGLDDDLVTNLNHRRGIAEVQIGKQDLVKSFIQAGYLPTRA